MLEEICRISLASIAPIIAIAGIVIAHQQYKGVVLKLKMDRYDRRLAIYRDIIKILSLIARDADISYDDLLQFKSNTAQSVFLFAEDIPSYIDEIYKMALDLRSTNEKLHNSDMPRGEERSKAAEEMQQQLIWLSKQLVAAKDKFHKYLNISD